jgi:phospholipase/carboxylesterase
MPGVADILSLGVAPAKARALCVLVHGRGQTPEDIAAIVARLSVADVAFALPGAVGASWYAARAIDPLTGATWGELQASLAGVGQVVADLRAQAPGVPLVLAGFSQGACLSLEAGFAGMPVDAVVAFTGCRVGVAGDERPQRLLPGLPVYLSAGDADPWIPVAAFAEAVGALGAGGARLTAQVFPGRAHEVSAEEVAMLDRQLAALMAERVPA